jgi:hypothetical protein
MSNFGLRPLSRKSGENKGDRCWPKGRGCAAMDASGHPRNGDFDMRKSIIMAVAAGALAIGGAASAQDLGSVLGSIFGYGNTTPGYSTSQPAVVAGTTPYYGSTPYGTYGTYGSNTIPEGTTLYADQYGRRFYYDQYGRQVMVDQVQQQQQQQQYGIVGYDQWGRPVYGNTSTYGTYGNGSSYGNYAYRTPDDRDGDGVPNWNDRWPDDPRYR